MKIPSGDCTPSRRARGARSGWPRKPRILFLLPKGEQHRPDRPIDPFTYAATELLPLYGVDCDLFEVDERSLFRRITRTFGNRGELLYFTLKALRRMREYDVLVAWHGPSVPIGLVKLILRIRSPKLVIVAYRLFNPEGSGLRTALKRGLVRLAMLAVDRIVCVAPGQVDTFASVLRIGTDKITFVPFGVDYNFFQINDGSGVEELVLPERFIVCPGDSDRDDDLLFTASRELPAAIVRVTRGTGIYLERLRRMAGETPSRFRVLHQISYGFLRAIYQKAIAIVLPVRNGSHPAGLTSILEAMAVGKPLIVTRGLSTDYYVQDGFTGLLVEPGSREEIVNAVRRVLEDKKLADSLGCNAVEIARAQFSVERSGLAFVRAISECLTTTDRRL